MIQYKRIDIPAKGIRTLCWRGNELIDWVGGFDIYHLDGTIHRGSVHIGYRFDAATESPSGRYVAAYERTGTKALILAGGKIVRELNRSYYNANAYEYPICLFTLPGGREAVAHCPDDYNVLQIDDLETGKRLTERDTSDAADFFHSRLSISPNGRWLMSAGWIWHPWDIAQLFEIEAVLKRPELLDKSDGKGFDTGQSGLNAAFLPDSRVAVASVRETWAMDGSEKEEHDTGRIGIYDPAANTLSDMAEAGVSVGRLMPAGPAHVIGFCGHPRLIEIATGKILHEWTDLSTGEQDGCLFDSRNKLPPPIALDPANLRFAVADKEKITVITLDSAAIK